jgi:hypothetical protein
MVAICKLEGWIRDLVSRYADVKVELRTTGRRHRRPRRSAMRKGLD